MKRCRFLLLALTGLMLVSTGCSRYETFPPGTVLDIQDATSAIVASENVTVAADQANLLEDIKEYRIGAGDVLAVTIPNLIERNNNGPNSADGKIDTVGHFRVYSSGKILLPLVGGVEVAGLTIEEIQARLIEVFLEYLRKPVVTVEIVEFKSQPLYLLGKFNAPGLYYLDRPTSLLHGLALGAGLSDSANLRGARLVRADRILPVDIFQLLYNNDLKQNVQLRPGDAIYVPGNEEQQVFVLGSVNNPGAVHMANGRLNLLQALSAAGLDGKPYDHSQVRIIRSLTPTRGQLMVVDLSQVMRGRALPLALNDGDIVFVPKTPMGGWNEAIGELLPTLQAFSAILQPFVQIQYLAD